MTMPAPRQPSQAMMLPHGETGALACARRIACFSRKRPSSGLWAFVSYHLLMTNALILAVRRVR